MPIAQLRPIAAFAAFSAAAAMISSCGNADHAPEASVKSASPDGVVAHSNDRATPDPCTLLSASEAQVYVGVLSTPPYRATDDGAADAAGDACLYRGSGARQLVIVRTGEGAAQPGKIISDVPNMVGGALEKAGAGNLAATTHRVMADVPNGPWDKATWIPGGTLFVTKGDQGVNVDVTGASGNQEDAVAIAQPPTCRR